MRSSKTLLWGLTATLALAPAAVHAETTAGPAATIQYTAYGIPHITANTVEGATFGQGYAQARDNVCAMAESYLTARGERSRFFGPDTAPRPGYAPGAATNLASDLFIRSQTEDGQLERLLARSAPYGPLPEVRQAARGFAAGYNRYLREARITDPACKGAAWVRPITDLDIFRLQYLTLFTLAGESAFVANGFQPAPGAPTTPPAPTATPGSNAIALGGKSTRGGGGVILGAPHLGWVGQSRFWQSQLTVPGTLDVSGATLLGLPLMVVGYTPTVGWSHTISTAKPMALVKLTLKDSTTYVVDGRPEKMTERRVGVNLAGGTTTTRTLRSTRYGPAVTIDGDTYAVASATKGNLRLLNSWYGFARAKTTDDLLTVLRTNQSSTGNTIAADSRGQALYADIQGVPNIPDACVSTMVSGMAIVDGSRSACAPGTDPDSLVPGTVGPARLPVLRNRDYTFNANDSHWLSSLDRPLIGFPRVTGDGATPRSLRTRAGLLSLTERLKKGPFDGGDLWDLNLDSRSYAADLAVDALVRDCAGSAEVRRACQVLAKWDRRFDVGSRGALLFTRYWQLLGTPDWRVPFDAADPLRTPRDPKPDLKALGDAVAWMRTAGVPLDARLGDRQYVADGGRRIPIPGGGLDDGLNVLEGEWDGGHLVPAYGNTYLQQVSFNDTGCPGVRTLLTYGQAADPTSPHHADQTRLYSTGRWVTPSLCGGAKVVETIKIASS